MGVKTFADTSVVKLAYQFSNYQSKAEWDVEHPDGTGKSAFYVVPFTTESFKASKESKMSTAISGDRRQKGSKNMKGSATGGFTIETGLNPTLVNTLIPAALMNSYTTKPATLFINNETHTLKNTSGTISYTGSGTTLAVYDGISAGTLVKSKYYASKSALDAATINASNPSGYYVVVAADGITAGSATVGSDVVTFADASGLTSGATSASIVFKVYGRRYVSATNYVERFYNEATQVFSVSTSDTFKFLTTSLPVVGSETETTLSLAGTIKTHDGLSDTSEKTIKVFGLTDSGQKLLKTVKVTGTVAESITVDSSVTGVSVRLLDSTAKILFDKVTIPVVYESSYSKSITDGTTIRPMLVEKYEKTTLNGTTYHEFNQFFGTCVNEFTMDFSGGDFVKTSVTTISTDFNLGRNKTSTSDDNLDVSLASSYSQVTEDELLDTTNSLKSITLFDEDGIEIPAVFSTASLKLTNNLREQTALGSTFAAGVGAGKVNVTLTGEIYFYNNDLFQKHLDNGKVSARIELEDSNEKLIIILPKLAVAAPSNNAQSENQDYKTSLTFNAEAGLVNLNGEDQECSIAVTYVV